MKLYFAPGACSLSPHIVLQEAGFTFATEKVDLKSHRTASGVALADITAKNYVPVLELDNGERLTEGTAIVQYLCDQKPEADLIPKAGSFERYRAQEWLNYIASELHKAFTPLFHRDTAAKEWQTQAEAKLAERFDWLSTQLSGKAYVLGERFSVVDAYLFVVLNWTNFVGIDLKRWPTLQAYVARVAARPAVQRALRAEGLLKAAA